MITLAAALKMLTNIVAKVVVYMTENGVTSPVARFVAICGT